MLYSVHFLRFIAALVVVVSHSANVLDVNKTVSVGDAGVDVFFIISGVVIGLSTKEGSSPYRFFVRRFIRIMPVYWIALFAFMAFRYNGWALVPEMSDFLHSFFLVPMFGTPWFPIVFQAWTLSFELMFYIAFGITLAIVRNNVALICSLVFLALASTNIPVPGHPGAFFETQVCAEFVAGLGLSYYLKVRRTQIEWIGLSCIAVAMIIFFFNRSLNATRIIAWGVPSAILLFGVVQFEGLPFLRNRYVQILGSASYAIYLFHITTMLWARMRIEAAFGIDLHDHALAAAAPLIAWAALTGIGIHLVVEQPLLNALRRVLLSRRTSQEAAGSGAA